MNVSVIGRLAPPVDRSRSMDEIRKEMRESLIVSIRKMDKKYDNADFTNHENWEISDLYNELAAKKK